MIRRVIIPFLAMISLLCCLLSPFFYFWGKLGEKGYKWIFLLASIFWFLFATLWASVQKKGQLPD